MNKRKCINCIFFNKQHPQLGNFSIKSEVRKSLDLLEKSFKHYSVNCYKGHWDTGYDPTLKSDIFKIIHKKRKKYECPFVPYEKGKLYSGAEETLKLIEVYKTRNIAKIGLIISVVSLLISSRELILKLFKHFF